MLKTQGKEIEDLKKSDGALINQKWLWLAVGVGAAMVVRGFGK